MTTTQTVPQQAMQQATTYQTSITLPRGTLALTYHSQADYQLDDLLGFAERINPKRAFLFVSKVLGRHIPASPQRMRQAFSDLANLIPNHLPTPIVVLGMAETAVGLSAGVHQTLQSRYPNAILLNSTRHAQTGKLFAKFSENHSHASEHLLYQSDDIALQQAVLGAKTLIMVDDEASTGQTCQNVVNALREAGMRQLQQVHLATLVDWSLGKVSAQPFDKIQFFRHYLLSGAWTWTDAPNPAPIHMPDVATTEAGSQPILATGDWGRKPTQTTHKGLDLLWQNLCHQITIEALADKKILVLGSNEFVWLPFLLAEKLVQVTPSTTTVKFSALTRSPIAVPSAQVTDSSTMLSAIRHGLSFTDNYGLGMTNFVYNVVPSEWDWIFLCVETPADSVDKLWQALNNVRIITPET